MRNKTTDIHYLCSFTLWWLLLIHYNISSLNPVSASETLTQHPGSDFQLIQSSLQDKSDLPFWSLKQEGRPLMNKKLQ